MDDKHTQLLAKHCRICANKLGRVAYSTVKHTMLLEQAFGVSVSVDQPEVHPASFCNRCYLTAQRVTKCAREGKHTETSCRPFEWKNHSDDCFFCTAAEAKKHGGRPKKVQIAGRGRPSLVIQHIRDIAGECLSGGHQLKPDCFVAPKSVDIHNLLCCVCQMVVDCPVEVVLCRHLVCLDCCISSLHGCTEFHCPACDCYSPVDKTSFTRVAPVVQQLLEGMQLQCPACNQVTHLGKLKQHQQSGCKTHIRVHEPTAHEIIHQAANTPPTELEQRAAAGVLRRMLTQEGERVVALPTGGRVSQKKTHALAYNFTVLPANYYSHLTS